MSQSGSITAGISPGGDVLTLQGDTGGAISPNGAGNIFVVGGPNVDVAGDQGSFSLTVNLANSDEETVVTTNDTPTTLYSFELDEEDVVTFDIIICAAQDDYSSGIGGRVTATFRREAGQATTLVGLPIVSYTEDSPGSPSFTMIASGNDAVLQVTGVAATTITWQARIVYVLI